MENLDHALNIMSDTLFYGSLPHWQRDPVVRIIREGQRRKRTIPEISYSLATGYHETDRWKYDEEIGKGRRRDYGEPILLIRGVRATYHGRGDTQLTWLSNYAKMSAYLSVEHGRPIDLVNHPELAKVPEYSSLIIWEGMVRGMFTGKNLADYFGDGRCDYVGARRIINGTDKAKRIAGYAGKFESALRTGGFEVAA